MIRRLLSKPLTWSLIAVLGLGAVFGLYWFQPWRLVTDKTVSDELAEVAAPSTASPATPPATSSTEPSAVPSAAQPGGSAPASPTGPRVVRQGAFVSHEHDTKGVARLVRNGDGTHQLELVDLDTSDGPDLRVWLTDQEVTKGATAWKVFDDGTHIELGRLKGNRGNQVYPIPAGAELETYRSISIWCKRFSVSFGAALLQ